MIASFDLIFNQSLSLPSSYLFRGLNINKSIKKHRVSVVMATLGGETVNKTIASLNEGTIVPNEILICIPEKEACNLIEIPFDNVRVVVTQCRGQVAQRAFGFKNVKNKMVLQIDDDILFEDKTLESLVLALDNFGKNNVVAPLYFNFGSGRCLHEYKVGFLGFIKSFYAYLVCDALWGKKRMGALTSLGIGYGVDGDFFTQDTVLVDWVPGGCVLSYDEDLIKENFFPFKGKAYSEDIIHSILRKEKGIFHHVVRTARCKTNSQPIILDAQMLIDDMMAREYVVSLLSGKKWCLRLWATFDYFKRVCLKYFFK